MHMRQEPFELVHIELCRSLYYRTIVRKIKKKLNRKFIVEKFSQLPLCYENQKRTKAYVSIRLNFSTTENEIKIFELKSNRHSLFPGVLLSIQRVPGDHITGELNIDHR